AVPRDRAIANLEVGLRFAETVLYSERGDRFNRFGNLHSAERARGDQLAGFVLGGERRFDRSVVRLGRTDKLDHTRYRQPVFLREIEIALVVRGHGPDGARAVTGPN